jgi:uncharacterized protein YndB with AHSA1/START domain
MSTRKHIHEETFDVTPERLFAILHTPSAIRGWWSASRAIVLAQRGGIWAATWGDSEDAPDYITVATIRDFEPPVRMVLTNYRYFAKSGPLPFEAQFVTEFTVTAHASGATLRVVQDGFPTCAEADAFYAGCEKGWRDTFAGIRRFVTKSA